MRPNSSARDPGLFIAWLGAWTIVPFCAVGALETVENEDAPWFMGAGILLLGGWTSWMLALRNGMAVKSSLPKVILWAALYFIGGLAIGVACGCAGCVMVGLKHL